MIVSAGTTEVIDKPIVLHGSLLLLGAIKASDDDKKKDEENPESPKPGPQEGPPQAGPPDDGASSIPRDDA